MARLQHWTSGLAAFSFSVALLAASTAVVQAQAEHGGAADIVRKESHPVLSRQKRDWIWNSFFVLEEVDFPVPSKIGQLKSNRQANMKKFKIEGEGANDIFIVNDQGDVFVTKRVDRETKSSYHMTAKMYDGNVLIEDAGEFVVQVNDINDHLPVFPKVYSGHIMERSPIATTVLEVKATDADDPTTPYAELRYSLRPEGETVIFGINAYSGAITYRNGVLDRETQEYYVVVVQAQDMGDLPTGSKATASVTISITDVNDNLASFTQNTYELQVREDLEVNEEVGTLQVEDRDEIQNKQPRFIIPEKYRQMFDVVLDANKDGKLILKKPLNYEAETTYSFTIEVQEKTDYPAENLRTAVNKSKVIIRVEDVDEPPAFDRPLYTFEVREGQNERNFGKITARDPDNANKSISYSILDKDCPITIHPVTGQLSTLGHLDRELKPTHMFQVKAQEEPSGLEAFVQVTIIVQDTNDNQPTLVADDIFVCENDAANTVIGFLMADDVDEQPATFTFSLASESHNFSIRNHGNNSADLLVKQGPFNYDDPKEYKVDIRITDGGVPVQSSITTVPIKVCRCDDSRLRRVCRASARRMSVSVHALIAILLCIVTILVIVILFVMRKRYQKDSLAGMKNSGEIHEQLVTYDEEGGGEMDTNGYDVSILSSACHDGSLLHRADRHPHPSLYAMVQKAPQPTACKGDMAAMIEVKKDEADHDRDGFPYDTLHIYGYEGPESLAGSLSSLDSSSTASNLDYDFLNDWGPRFRSLAELYGVDGPDYYHQY
ncbi:hypothetical protein INR49_020362 [Caranx melampygus]|nr:hypothetical protein INR49_020362 [Caranx melampygus]